MRDRLEQELLMRQRTIIASVIALGVLASMTLGVAAVEGVVDGAFHGVEATNDEPITCSTNDEPFDGGGGGGGGGGC